MSYHSLNILLKYIKYVVHILKTCQLIGNLTLTFRVIVSGVISWTSISSCGQHVAI